MNQPTTHCSYCHTAMCKGCRTAVTDVPDKYIQNMIVNDRYSNSIPRGSQKDNIYTGGYKYLY